MTIDSTQLADLDLAYAISIHKAQGSEYNQIIIPVLTAFSTKKDKYIENPLRESRFRRDRTGVYDVKRKIH